MRTHFDDRAFSAAGPRCWNSLLPVIRFADSVNSFKAQLHIKELGCLSIIGGTCPGCPPKVQAYDYIYICICCIQLSFKISLDVIIHLHQLLAFPCQITSCMSFLIPNSVFQCEPLYGWGFRRGGYQCMCKPGYRYPPWQYGPFQGIEIESATGDEYKNGFDCIPVECKNSIITVYWFLI